MEWRYIPFQKYDPYFKTGLNQAAMESVGNGNDPLIFLAGWDRKCVNVGRSQNVKDEVDLERAREDGVTIVRRQGGGGTTYLTPGGEITWGLVTPEDYFTEDVNRTYEKVCSVIAEALGRISIQARHELINDVVTDKGKISGATLKRQEGAVYVGGTLLYSVDPEEMFRYLTPREDKLSDKPVESFEERVTSVRQESAASFQETQEALKLQFLEHKDWKEANWNEKERDRAEQLANKYREEEWIYRE